MLTTGSSSAAEDLSCVLINSPDRSSVLCCNVCYANAAWGMCVDLHRVTLRRSSPFLAVRGAITRDSPRGFPRDSKRAYNSCLNSLTLDWMPTIWGTGWVPIEGDHVTGIRQTSGEFALDTENCRTPADSVCSPFPSLARRAAEQDLPRRDAPWLVRLFTTLTFSHLPTVAGAASRRRDLTSPHLTLHRTGTAGTAQIDCPRPRKSDICGLTGATNDVINSLPESALHHYTDGDFSVGLKFTPQVA
jgi:hypothetical protein